MSKQITESVDPYQMIHDRLEATRGKAKDYRCADGCGEQAQEWSLDADTIGNVQWVRTADGQARQISDQVFDYSPRTRRCHRRHDRALAAQRERETEGLSDYVDYGDGYLGYRGVTQPTLDDGDWVTT